MATDEQQVEIRSRLTGDVPLAVHSEALSWSNLRGANLRGANLRDADLRDADLRDANLSGADLSGANLSDANLRRANLRVANLSVANLSDANLSVADLSDANLSDADLRGANLSGANLSGADLSDADLRGAVGNGREVSTLQLGRYHVVVTGELMAIGCQTRLIADWLALNETQIKQCDGSDAVEWAATWRPAIEAFLTARAKGVADGS